MKKETKFKYTPLSEEKIKELALQVYRNEIFTSCQIKPEDSGCLTTIFMPLIFMEKAAKNIFVKYNAVFYSKISEAGPRSINGYPIFMQFQWCSGEDFDKVVLKYKHIKEMIEGNG